MNKELVLEVKENLKELKIPGVSNRLSNIIDDAYKSDISYEMLLKNVFEIALDQRKENGRKSRIRNAKFPFIKYLEDLRVEYLPEEGRKKLRELKTLKFIEEGRNVIMSGSAGTGKSHIAVGLGIEACNAGYKVMFTTIPLLINELKEARSKNTLRSYEKRFEKYDLVIADELGYISFDKEGSELLFTYLSLRAERKSTIITSNLMFNKWDDIFKDPVLTAAMVDRLTHKAHIINMNGSSYRTMETLEMLKG